MKPSRVWLAAALIALIGCGSQQLRLTSPDTTPGVSYTCTAANTCYPASLATPPEGEPDQALPLTIPSECQGHVHEIVIRDSDSSSPEYDVTCATGGATAPAPAAEPPAQPAQPPPDAITDPNGEPPRVEDNAIDPQP